MRLLVSILLTFFPSFLENRLRNVMLGQIIGKGSKIGFLAIISAKSLRIGRNSRIKSFTFISAESVEIGDYCVIKSLSVISSRIVVFKNYVHIANFCFIRGPKIETSKISIGNHSRVFPFCWLDTNTGITIGNDVGIGGFTLIFTHGVWSNYFKGGPVTFKEVVIEDDVWLPWRVFVMPGVTIGKKSIIGANSLVNKSIPENSLAAGSPATVLKANFLKELDDESMNKRLDTALKDFYQYLIFKKVINSYHRNENEFSYSSDKLSIKIDVVENDEIKDLELIILTKNTFSKKLHGNYVWEMNSNTIYYKKNQVIEEFIDYMRRYGVRLNRSENHGDLH